jgi:hypothetical protein
MIWFTDPLPCKVWQLTEISVNQEQTLY